MSTRRGDEAIFQVAKMLPSEISPKLTPLAIQARRAAGAGKASQQRPLSDTTAVSGDGIAAQIEKLADLHAKGILTDEEFMSKKADLLDRI